MMVRNPYRPPWLPLWLRSKFELFLGMVNSGTLHSLTHEALHIRWAARHACKRLRERCQLHARTCHELKTDNERLQQRLTEVERERDEANSKLDEWQRMFRDAALELDAEHTKLIAAKQEVARLRVLIKPISMGPCTCTRFRDGSVRQCRRCRASAAMSAYDDTRGEPSELEDDDA